MNDATWESIQRADYLAMYARHEPLWTAVREFIAANDVQSLVEAGCGIAALASHVATYTGIDLNADVLAENSEQNDATWLHSDWNDVDAAALDAEMFLAASLIEHCESFEPFLMNVLRMQRLKYAVVTFHKGLRDVSKQRRRRWKRNDQTGWWFDNYYSQDEIVEWLRATVSAKWALYTLEHSYRWSNGPRWDSVLVIDTTGQARQEMFGERMAECD